MGNTLDKQITVLKPESSVKLYHTTKQRAMKTLFLKFSVSHFSGSSGRHKTAIVEMNPSGCRKRTMRWAARNTTMLTAKRRKLGSSGFLTFEHYPFPSHLRRRRRGGTEHKRTVLGGLRRRLEVWIVLPTCLASGKSPQLFGPATSIMKDLNCHP